MLRFIAWLMKREYEPCKGCEVFKGQMERLESQNRQLMDRLLKLSEPELIPSTPVIVPQKPRIGNWQQAKREMEAQDRVEAETRRKIAETEKELEVASTGTGTESK